MATGTFAVEFCLYKGNSSSEKLYDLIVRFRALEIKMSAKYYITHVSGQRMVAQGTDGVSRGHLRKRLSIGDAMLIFYPWGKCAIDFHPPIKSWIESWSPKGTEFLQPKDWYSRAHNHDGGFYDKINFTIL